MKEPSDPSIEQARLAGFDLNLIELNLSLTPEERWRQHDMALTVIQEFEQARLTNRDSQAINIPAFLAPQQSPLHPCKVRGTNVFKQSTADGKSRQSEELAIFNTTPFHERNDEYVLTDEKGPKPMRKIFVEENFHVEVCRIEVGSDHTTPSAIERLAP